MTNPLETAHQTITAGSGVAATAATVGVTPGHLYEVLQGRRRITPTLAAALAAQTGQTTFALMQANTDEQFLRHGSATL